MPYAKDLEPIPVLESTLARLVHNVVAVTALGVIHCDLSSLVKTNVL